MVAILKGQATPVAIVAGVGATGGTPLGFQSLTGLDTAKALTVPQGATYALISPSAQAVRWRDDGNAPTGAVGMPIAVGQQITYSGNLAAIKFIEQAASATLNVSYYK